MGCKRVTIFFYFDTLKTRLGHGYSGTKGAQEVHERGTRGAREVHERGTRGTREGHERGRRGAFVGTKGDTVFFILTRLGHGWDTVGTRGHWRHRCTRGAREGHERCTRGAREGHKRGTRGAREGHERCTRGASLNFPTTIYIYFCFCLFPMLLHSSNPANRVQWELRDLCPISTNFCR